MRLSPVVLLLLVGVAVAKPLTLVPFKATGFSVSMPKGWVVTPADGGIVAAQQDPKRKDAAAILLSFGPNTSNATEAQLLDLVVAQVAKDVKVLQRKAFPGGGQVLIADATAEGIKVRLGAIAAVGPQTALFGLVVAKAGDFDGIGGIELLGNVITSISPDAPVLAPSPPTATPPATGTNEIPALTQRLTPADLVGEWGHDDSAFTNYVSSSTGAYAGYSAVSYTEKWLIDANGGVQVIFHGYTGGHLVDEKSKGTITISADGTFEIKTSTQKVSSKYLIRGWSAKPEATFIKLSGPWYDAIPDEARRDPRQGVSAVWTRKPAKAK
jgi:hypothetical protein